jgi:hypothetical protein
MAVSDLSKGKICAFFRRFRICNPSSIGAMVVEVSRVEVEVEDGVVKFARARAHHVHELIRHVTGKVLGQLQ